MFGWLDTLAVKIFGKEPAVKIMYSIILFVVMIVIIPKEIRNNITTEVEIYWIFYVVVYAISFVLIDAIQRFLPYIKVAIHSFLDSRTIAHKAKEKDTLYKNIISELNKNEKAIISSFLKEKTQIKYLVSYDIAVSSLRMKGIICKNSNMSTINNEKIIVDQYIIKNDIFKLLQDNFQSNFSPSFHQKAE